MSRVVFFVLRNDHAFLEICGERSKVSQDAIFALGLGLKDYMFNNRHMFSKEKYLFPDIAYGKYTCTDMYLGCFGVGEIQ